MDKGLMQPYAEKLDSLAGDLAVLPVQKVASRISDKATQRFMDAHNASMAMQASQEDLELKSGGEEDEEYQPAVSFEDQLSQIREEGRVGFRKLGEEERYPLVRQCKEVLKNDDKRTLSAKEEKARDDYIGRYNPQTKTRDKGEGDKEFERYVENHKDDMKALATRIYLLRHLAFEDQFALEKMLNAVKKLAAFTENLMLVSHYNYEMVTNSYKVDREMRQAIEFESNMIETVEEQIEGLEESIVECNEEAEYERKQIRLAEEKNLSKTQVDDAKEQLKLTVDDLSSKEASLHRLKNLSIDKPLMFDDDIVSVKTVAASMDILNKVILRNKRA